MNVSEIANMDDYLGVEADNFAVSRHQSSSVRFPSPDYFCQWGVANSEHFGSPNEFCIGATNLMSDELNFNGKDSPDEVEAETSIPGESSTASSWCEGFPFLYCGHMHSEASLNRTRDLTKLRDYQPDGTEEKDQTDDIFLRFLEETSPHMEDPYRSISLYPDIDCSTMQSEYLLKDMIVHPQSMSLDTSTISSSKDLDGNANCLASSADQQRVENMPNFMPANLGKMEDCSTTKEPAVPRLVSAEPDSPNNGEGHLNAGKSLEESVLQELEGAMEQVKLTKGTRLCFRDALYRLAKSSEQSQLHVGSRPQSGDISIEKHSSPPVPCRTSRFPRENAGDYQTNTIDRTIEKLMFEKLDCNRNDLSFDESVTLSEENVMMENSSTTYGLNCTPIPPYPRCSLLPQDAGTFVFGDESNTMVGFY